MIRLFLKFSIGSWGAAALSILTLPIVTALVRPDEFGRAAMFSLTIGLLAQMAMLGTDQAYVRDFYGARDKGEGPQLLREALAVPLALALAIGAAVLAMGDWLTAQAFGIASPRAAALIAAGVGLVVVERYAMLTLRMKQHALSFSMLRLVAALVQFGVTVGYALWVAPDFLSIATAQMAALAVAGGAAILLARSEWRPGPVRAAAVRRIIAYGLPFVPAFAAMWLVEGIDKLMLRHFSSFAELGLFSAAFRFVALVSILQSSFSTFWVPVSFELFERDAEEARTTFSSSLQRMAPLLFLGGFAVLLGKDLIALLFAADYRDAARVMPFLLFVPIMYSLFQVTIGGIAFARRPRWNLLIAAVAALTNFLLNLWLVPNLGALGAAVSTGVSYILLFVLGTAISQRLFAIQLRAGRLAQAIALFAAACAAHSFAPAAWQSYAGSVVGALAIIALFRGELAETARRGFAAARRA